VRSAVPSGRGVLRTAGPATGWLATFQGRFATADDRNPEVNYPQSWGRPVRVLIEEGTWQAAGSHRALSGGGRAGAPTCSPVRPGFQGAVFMEEADFIEEKQGFRVPGTGRIKSRREEITPALSRSSQFHPLVPHPAFGHPLPCPRERETALSPACPAGRPRRRGIIGRPNAVRCLQ